MFSCIVAPLSKLTDLHVYFQPKSCELKQINVSINRTDTKLQSYLYYLCDLVHIHIEYSSQITQHVSRVLQLQAEVIRGRTRTSRQPLQEDLKRIDYIPFTGLLEAAAG